MTLLESKRCKIEKLRAQGKLCSATVPHFYGGVSPCLFSATLEYEGKRYCVKHYPPTAQARKVVSRERRRVRLQRELAELEAT